ncbi:hypothetical protein [Streptomyces sp. NPDC086519]|uniref:hypothetical protein n=1 Tax=Streptomyces sp. NPDC086519 TaxID=3154863 RepID=UPI00342DC571
MARPSEARWTTVDGYVADVLSAPAADPGEEVVHCPGVTATAAEHIRSVAGTHRVLREAGAGRGTVVAALTAPSSPDTTAVRHAAQLLGAAVCHPRSTNLGSSTAMPAADDRLRPSGPPAPRSCTPARTSLPELPNRRPRPAPPSSARACPAPSSRCPPTVPVASLPRAGTPPTWRLPSSPGHG